MKGESDQSRGARSESPAEGWRALARSWPRPLIAAGRGEELARWWRAGEEAGRAQGRASIALASAAPELLEALSAARRARRLQRGLEGAAALLDSEEAGLRAAAATRPVVARISRLLVVSRDGSERFDRQVERLRVRHASRLEVLMLDCDEWELGGAVFGRGRSARAVLLDHKEAVASFLLVLDETLGFSGIGEQSQ